MSRTRLNWVLTASVAAVAAVSNAAVGQDASSQTAVAAVNELPPVIVEGGTLEAKPVVKAKPKPKAQPVAVDEPDPEPEPAKAAKKIKKATGAAKAKPANKPATATAPADDAASQPVAAASEPGDAGAATSGEGASVAGVAAEKLGTAVTVVTGEQLRAQQVRTAGDALRSLPGVSVSRSNGATGLTQVRIRGAEGNHTLVMIDGVEANDTTNGEFDFSDLATDNIEQIEVIRGPQSGLYGSGALGGVVNIITKSGRGPLTFSSRVEGGSFDTSDIAARVSAGTDRGWGSISYNERTTNGFNVSPLGSEKDSGSLKTFAVKAGAKVSDDVSIDFNLRNVRKFGDRDGFGGPAGTLATATDDPSTFASDIWLAGVNVRWDMFNGALSHVFRASNNRTERTDFDKSFFPFTSRNDSETTKYGYLATLRFDTPMFVAARHTVSGLIEKADEDFTPLSDFEDGITRGREQLSTVAEYRGEFDDTLYVTGSVRHDNNSAFEDFTTWRTNASLALRDIGLRPHASAGTGVKMPTQFEQFGSFPSFFLPNPNLKPEKSFGWDAGVEATIVKGGLVIDVTYFEANLEDKIRGVGFPTTPINLAGISERRGVEVAAQAPLTRNLVLGLSYTYLDATDPDGVEEARRAPHSGRADLTYVFADGLGRFNVAAIYNGSMQDDAFRMPFFATERVSLDSYWLVNVAASYTVQPGVEVFGRVENLLDQQYQEVFGFETSGIAAYAGVKFTYEEPSTKDWVKYK